MTELVYICNHSAAWGCSAFRAALRFHSASFV